MQSFHNLNSSTTDLYKEIDGRYFQWIINTNDSKNIKPYSGKWMIFVYDKDLKNTWNTVKDIVKTNNLYQAKVATLDQLNPNSISNTVSPIFVYTTDYRDKENVKYVADLIHPHININKPIYYKTNKATSNNIYSTNSKTKVSIYKHEKSGLFYECINKKWVIV